MAVVKVKVPVSVLHLFTATPSIPFEILLRFISVLLSGTFLSEATASSVNTPLTFLEKYSFAILIFLKLAPLPGVKIVLYSFTLYGSSLVNASGSLKYVILLLTHVDLYEPIRPSLPLSPKNIISPLYTSDNILLLYGA